MTLGIFKDRADPPASSGYATVGGQPSAATGAKLAATAEAAAVDRDQAARAVVAAEAAPPEPGPVPVLAIRTGNQEWQPLTIVLQPGEVAELVGREGIRDTFDIVNQSATLNGGTAVMLALTRDRDHADMLANGSTPFLGAGRHVYLPDGASRTMTHSAPMYVVADPAAAGTAMAYVDVSTELGERYGHPYGHHRAHK